jgi:hypothetical protein
MTGTGVVDVRPGSVRLASGVELPADVVLVAIGARPTTGWLAGTLPVDADGSLAVDEGHRVLGPDGRPVAGSRVVAVGDLARRRSPRHGWVPGGHWDGALRGPAVAVRSLLAGLAGVASSTATSSAADSPGPAAPAEDPAPYVFSTQLGHELGMHGIVGARDELVLRGDPTGPFSALWFSPGSDELTAVLAVDRPRDVGAARKLFTGPRLPRVDRTRAADPGVPLR